jgi:hypothetical protein
MDVVKLGVTNLLNDQEALTEAAKLDDTGLRTFIASYVKRVARKQLDVEKLTAQHERLTAARLRNIEGMDQDIGILSDPALDDAATSAALDDLIGAGGGGARAPRGMPRLRHPMLAAVVDQFKHTTTKDPEEAPKAAALLAVWVASRAPRGEVAAAKIWARKVRGLPGYEGTPKLTDDAIVRKYLEALKFYDDTKDTEAYMSLGVAPLKNILAVLPEGGPTPFTGTYRPIVTTAAQLARESRPPLPAGAVPPGAPTAPLTWEELATRVQREAQPSLLEPQNLPDRPPGPTPPAAPIPAPPRAEAPTEAERAALAEAFKAGGRPAYDALWRQMGFQSMEPRTMLQEPVRSPATMGQPPEYILGDPQPISTPGPPVESPLPWPRSVAEPLSPGQASEHIRSIQHVLEQYPDQAETRLLLSGRLGSEQFAERLGAMPPQVQQAVMALKNMDTDALMTQWNLLFEQQQAGRTLFGRGGVPSAAGPTRTQFSTFGQATMDLIARELRARGAEFAFDATTTRTSELQKLLDNTGLYERVVLPNTGKLLDYTQRLGTVIKQLTQEGKILENQVKMKYRTHGFSPRQQYALDLAKSIKSNLEYRNSTIKSVRKDMLRWTHPNDQAQLTELLDLLENSATLPQSWNNVPLRLLVDRALARAAEQATTAGETRRISRIARDVYEALEMSPKSAPQVKPLGGKFPSDVLVNWDAEGTLPPPLRETLPRPRAGVFAGAVERARVAEANAELDAAAKLEQNRPSRRGGRTDAPPLRGRGSPGPEQRRRIEQRKRILAEQLKQGTAPLDAVIRR